MRSEPVFDVHRVSRRERPWRVLARDLQHVQTRTCCGFVSEAPRESIHLAQRMNDGGIGEAACSSSGREIDALARVTSLHPCFAVVLIV